jgi:cysteine-rich repeat protein
MLRAPLSRPLLSLVTVAALALVSFVSVLPTGCASSTAATTGTVKCSPGSYVFCRCQDREEGTKVCNEDGRSFGLCEPCETYDNPSIPDDPGLPPTPVDAGDGSRPGSAVCGDKVVQDGEDCDDGNKVDDDGCDATCKLAGPNPSATRSCPGLDTHVWDAPVVYVGTTVGAPLTAELTAQNCTSTMGGNPTRGASGPDRIFEVTAHKAGTMTVSATDTNYDALLYVTKTCQSPAPITHLTCANDKNGIGSESMAFQVQAGETYSVVVDGAGVSAVQGAFKLTLSIQ